MSKHKSDKPFPQALADAMEMRDIPSSYALSDRVRAANKDWGSQATMNRYLRGELPFTMKAAENLARALNIKPEYFAEYRLGLARAHLDPDQVGLKIALKNLARFER